MLLYLKYCALLDFDYSLPSSFLHSPWWFILLNYTFVFYFPNQLPMENNSTILLSCHACKITALAPMCSKAYCDSVENRGLAGEPVVSPASVEEGTSTIAGKICSEHCRGHRRAGRGECNKVRRAEMGQGERIVPKWGWDRWCWHAPYPIPLPRWDLPTWVHSELL